MTRPWMVDVSYYQDPARFTSAFWAACQAHGMRRVTVKYSMGFGTDTAAPRHAANVRDVHGLGLDAYHWVDPTNTVTAQLNNLARRVDACPPDIINADLEQWWGSWTEYYKAIKGLIPWSAVPRVDPQRLSEHARVLVAEMRRRFAPLPVRVYTGQWFPRGYSPQMFT